MRKNIFITMILIICMLLCSCQISGGGDNQEWGELVIKINYESPNAMFGVLDAKSCFSRDPIVAVDSSFGTTLTPKQRIFEEGMFVYTYDWGEIQPTDKVYIRPAIVVAPKVDSVRCYELKEGVVADIDGDEWFTVESVNKTTKTMGFDGLTSVEVIIKRHSGIFPHLLWIAASGEGYVCEGIAQTDFELGQYTKGHYGFSLNAFDAMFGNLILITSPKEGLYNTEDVFTLVRDYKMDIMSEVEVEVVR